MVCVVIQEMASEEQAIHGSELNANILHSKKLETNGLDARKRNTTDSFLLPRIMCSMECKVEN